MKVLIAGASGLVGKTLIKLLLNSDRTSSVISIVRKSMNIDHKKLVEKIIDFDNLETELDAINVEVAYCCLGTTIKKAGTKENFEKVDLHYPLRLAEHLHDLGTNQFNIITAIGSNPNSSFYYNRIKGKVEEKLRAVGFTALNIFRPSLLIGNREEHRVGEKLAIAGSKVFNPFLFGPFKKYRGIKSEDVAMAMMVVGLDQSCQGMNIFESDKIQSLADLSNSE